MGAHPWVLQSLEAGERLSYYCSEWEEIFGRVVDPIGEVVVRENHLAKSCYKPILHVRLNTVWPISNSFNGSGNFL